MNTRSYSDLKIAVTLLAFATIIPFQLLQAQDTDDFGRGIPLLSPSNSGWTLYDDDWGKEKTFANLASSSDPDNGVKQVLEISGDFSNGGRFAGAIYNLPNVDIDTLSMQVKSRECTAIDIRVFDATSQCFEFTYAIDNGVSWHPITLSIKKLIAEVVNGERPYTDKVTTWTNWGGANDGKWKGKATAISLMIPRNYDHPVISASFGDIMLMKDATDTGGLSSNNQ